MQRVTYICNNKPRLKQITKDLLEAFEAQGFEDITGEDRGVKSLTVKTYYDTENFDLYEHDAMCRKVIYNADGKDKKIVILQFVPKKYGEIESYNLECQNITSEEIGKILQIDTEIKPRFYLKSNNKHFFFTENSISPEYLNDDCLVEVVLKDINIYNAEKKKINDVALFEIKDRTLDIANDQIAEDLKQKVVECFHLFESVMKKNQLGRLNRPRNVYLHNLVKMPKRYEQIEKN